MSVESDMSTHPPINRVTVYAGWPLRQLSQFTRTAYVAGNHLADADNDGTAELLLLTGGQLQALDPATGALLWATEGNGSEILVDQLDDDPIPEIAVGGPLGRILDGATRAIEYEHTWSFGQYLTSGRVGIGGSRALIATEPNGGFTVFEDAPWSPRWTFASPQADAILALDVDGDGIDEILQADNQSGSLHLVDSQSRTLRISFPNTEGGATNLLHVRDSTTGNGLIGFMPSSPNTKILQLIEPASGAIRWDLEFIGSISPAVTIADVDNDGTAEYVVGSSDGSSDARLRIFDARSGDLEWRSPVPVGANAPFQLITHHFHTAQMDADPQLEIIAIGNRVHSSAVLMIDGLTHQIETSVEFPEISERIFGSELFDYDQDGWPDLLLGRYITSGTDRYQLSVLSLRTGQWLWHSVSLGSPPAMGLMVLEGAAQSLLVACASSGLYAYGASSGLLEWTHPVDIKRAVYLPNGQNGPEILIERPDRTVLHLDPVSLGVLRQYVIPEASNSIKAVPGSGHYLIRTSDELTLRDYFGNPVALGTTPFAPSGYGASTAVAALGSDFEVLIGTYFGYSAYDFSVDGLFADGMEASK